MPACLFRTPEQAFWKELNPASSIFSAQEQALQTNWLKSRITGGEVDRLCRKCKEFPEKISHVVSGCSKLAGSAYKKGMIVWD